MQIKIKSKYGKYVEKKCKKRMYQDENRAKLNQ